MIKVISYIYMPLFLLKRFVFGSKIYSAIVINCYKLLGANIDDKVTFQYGALLSGCKNITIKNGTFIGRGVSITAYKEKVIIGSNCLIAADVKIISRSHNYMKMYNNVPILEQGYSHKEVLIGNNVWIGFNSIILSGVTICNNVVIAAGSVVTHSIDTPGVYGGIPAKLIKKSS
ncbi:acyltransferase [Photobacterium leiognathi]|uniref:acyltransferase n=1 Tax=Photobacterium leiognathi TaxID=553611 RepID=UPI0029817D31|nr:acyltransferase [Photobacterium leiognathi]